MNPALLALILTQAQAMRIDYILQEAPSEISLRAAGIFIVESSAGADRKRRDKASFGWFQLRRQTACLMGGYSAKSLRACPITKRELETNTALNTQLGLAYIQYCAEAFPDSESRAIACHRWGVPKTRAMSAAKLKKLETGNGYVARVLRAEKQLESIKKETD